jgi:hypothetical protein
MNGTDIREIHIDCQNLTEDDRTRFLALGFQDDWFVSAGGGITCPPFHLTWQTEGERKATTQLHSSVLARCVKIVEEAESFIGYLESEIIIPENHLILQSRPFIPCVRSPLPKIQLHCSLRNKVADLHIKVPLSSVAEELEHTMSEAGVYFVETPKGNRIYTLQFYSHVDGRAAFRVLGSYFQECGGATEVTYEVCSCFLRKPTGLPVPAVVRRGTLRAHLQRQGLA